MKRLFTYIGIASLLVPSISFGAIAFDTAYPGGYFATLNGNTLTSNITSTSTNWLYVCGGFGLAPAPTDSITGFQRAGKGFTKAGSIQTNSADGRWETLWYQIAPTSGNFATYVSSTGGDGAFDCSLWNGVAQTNPVEVVASGTVASATTLDIGITTLTDNDWLIGAARNEHGGSVAVGTSTVRVNDLNGNAILDKGPIVTAGATGLAVGTGAGAFPMSMVVIAVKAAVPAPTSTRPIRCIFGSGRTTGCSR